MAADSGPLCDPVGGCCQVWALVSVHQAGNFCHGRMGMEGLPPKGWGTRVCERDSLVPATRLGTGLRTILRLVTILATAEGPQLWTEPGSFPRPLQVISGLVSFKER